MDDDYEVCDICGNDVVEVFGCSSCDREVCWDCLVNEDENICEVCEDEG